jgi:Na+:H+ antiporter, NhaA family
VTKVLFPGPSLTERSVLARVLRSETVGGGLMMGAAVLAIVLANSPWSGLYDDLRAFTFGPDIFKLRLDVLHWVQDGLLAIFFAVAGLELRREFTHGDLKDPRNAALPIIAALGGMIVPAVFFLAVTFNDEGARRGWAIPMATDIAFALAVLAIVGRNLPSALRAFLLTLAIVDDLVAIIVIAVAFTSDLNLLAMGSAAATLVVYGLLQKFGYSQWWIALPIALIAWTALHASGVHATVAGVAIGVLTSNKRPLPGVRSPEERYEDFLRPISSGLAVPLFAFVSAGVPISIAFLQNMTADPAAVGVILGLVLGKIVGVFGASYLTARFTRATLNPRLAWSDVFGVSCITGIGFTVSLLIASLAFGPDTARTQNLTAAILVASATSTLLAALVLNPRNKWYGRDENQPGYVQPPVETD